MVKYLEVILRIKFLILIDLLTRCCIFNRVLCFHSEPWFTLIVGLTEHLSRIDFVSSMYLSNKTRQDEITY